MSCYNSKPNKLYISDMYIPMQLQLDTSGTLVSIPNSTYSGNFDISNVVMAITDIAGDILSVLKTNNSIEIFDYFSTRTSSFDLSQSVINIYTNYNSFAALKTDGTVTAWGLESSGGSIPSSKIPKLINVKNITSTLYAYAALKTNGSVVTWGNPYYGGDYLITNRNSNSTKCLSIENKLCGVVKIFSNLYSFAALRSDGSVITWGNSLAGGNSSIIYSNSKNETSVRKKLQSGIINIFSTNFAYAALKYDGSVVTWGNASYGGDSSNFKSELESQVIYIANTSSSFAALKSNGSVITWGKTYLDKQPSGQSCLACKPKVVSLCSKSCINKHLCCQNNNVTDLSTNLSSSVISITSTLKAFAALKSNGSVVAWGKDSYGGNLADVSANLLSDVVKIYSNNYAFAALKSNGSVITWGDGSYGGNSSNVSNKISSNVVAIYSSTKAFAALKSDGLIVTWGDFWLGGNLVISPEKNITTIIGKNNFLFISTKQKIPLKPILISSSPGQVNIFQNDISNNISGYKYNLINWTNNWSKFDLSNCQITLLPENKVYYISLRSFNTIGISESNEFIVQSDQYGNIQFNIVFSNLSV